MPSAPKSAGRHIESAAAAGEEQAKRRVNQTRNQKTRPGLGRNTINNAEGELMPVRAPQPHKGCVPDKAPCGCCAACKHRASLKAALTFDNPADRADVLAKLGLALLEEPEVRGPDTSPVLREGLYVPHSGSVPANVCTHTAAGDGPDLGVSAGAPAGDSAAAPTPK